MDTTPIQTTQKQTPKKSPWLLIIILLIIISIPCLFVLLSNPAGSVKPKSTSYVIQYKITGTAGGADLTYENSTGGTEQKEVKLPYEDSFMARRGAYLYISAQNTGEYGTVRCEILVNGQVVKSAESSGAYKIATCSGRLE